MVKKKVVPFPGCDSNHILPEWRSTIFLHTASPIPVPDIRARMEPLKNQEYPVVILRLDADPVVADAEDPGVFLPPGPDVDFRPRVPRNLMALPTRF